MKWFKDQWGKIPKTWRWAIYIIAALLLIFLLWYGKTWIGDKVFDIRSWLFDREQAAATEREKKLERDRDAAIDRAELKEAEGEMWKQRAVDAETKNVVLEGLAAAKGGQIAKEVDRLEKELELIHKQDGTCAQIADEKARVACLCAKLKAKGFECQ